MARPLSGRSVLDDLTTNLRKAGAIKAALELDVFSRIAEGNHSLPAFRRATGLNERAARLLLDALANIGLLTRTDFEYALSPTAETFLVKGKPTYYGEVLLAQWLWDGRGQTGKSVKSGKPLPASADPLLNHSRESSTWFDPASAMQEFAPVWDELSLNSDETQPFRILAFGVEAALRSFPLLHKYANARLAIVDLSAQFSHLNYVEQLEFISRVDKFEGVWSEVALAPDSFELAVVDSITETRSIEENIGILHRAHQALVMGGRVLLRAAMEEDDRRGPDLVPLLGLDLLLSSTEGDVYTRTEYRGMLEAAGFFDVQPVGDRLNLWTARRLPPPAPAPPVDTLAPDFIPPPEVLT